jgi:hypothetical protein
MPVPNRTFSVGFCASTGGGIDLTHIPFFHMVTKSVTVKDIFRTGKRKTPDPLVQRLKQAVKYGLSQLVGMAVEKEETAPSDRKIRREQQILARRKEKLQRTTSIGATEFFPKSPIFDVVLHI